MKIIIPMAGSGSRFVKAGIAKPKHEILAHGKTLFYWSMKSLEDFFDKEFIFIYRGDERQASFIESQCKELGISAFKLLRIDALTAGQASTVMQCDQYIDPNDAVGIYNIDTYVEPGEILQAQISSSTSGFIPSFKATGDRWSFIQVDPQTQLVTNVSEKVKISDNATVGFYYFDNWATYKRLYNDYREEIIRDYKETYIAPMYNYLIQENLDVTYHIIPADKIHVLGTPEDLKQFCPEFFTENLGDHHE